MVCCGGSYVSPRESREPIRYDPTFNGPIHNRSCTDILWLIVFVLFLGGWGYVGYYGLTRGSIEKILAPIDSKGRRCGLDSGLEEKKILCFSTLPNVFLLALQLLVVRLRRFAWKIVRTIQLFSKKN
ncbi:unnamed protein product [Pieris macdunnoughi]|uniref:Uncharacterized protein n=1 Tax=Pieris macdunnoughi TaxID=345717 RepID=A0A821N8K5_9NEOP|nr:unnamed protein product [Pieris macdunnoughi]